MIIAVALSPSLDVTYLVDDLRPGGIHRPTESLRVAGGKALNAARAAATIGADVAAISALGGANGAAIEHLIAGEHVELVQVDARADTRTCVTIHSRLSGELTEVYERASDVSGPESAAAIAALDLMGEGRSGWVVLSGSLPASLPEDTFATLVDHARSCGFRVAVDTHGGALAAVVGRRPDLVKVNRAEAVELLGADPGTPVADLVDDLHRRAGSLVVITDGVAGAVGTEGGSVWRARLGRPVGEFPVGSGDSFLGGLVASLDRGDPLERAIRVAAACGTANTLVPGAAARFDRVTVDALVADVELIEETR